MFLERLFGNTFGLIWLIIFVAGVLTLIIWMFAKKEVKVDNESNTEENIVEEQNQSIVENDFEENVETKEEKPVFNSEYEIIECEDGFFRVRKVGTERTLRKFSTKIEAENFIEKRGLKND